jgi:hypothetical protein
MLVLLEMLRLRMLGRGKREDVGGQCLEIVDALCHVYRL